MKQVGKYQWYGIKYKIIGKYELSIMEKEWELALACIVKAQLPSYHDM